TISPLANDGDLDGDTLIITDATSTNGTVVIVGGTNLVFTPSTNFNGTTTITYTISDGNGGSASATVTATVTPVNDPPVAVDDSATTPEDVSVTIAPLANDSDLDGDTLSITNATATNGTVVIVGGTNLLFSPSTNFNGTTTIPYTISDGNGGTASATVTVTVTPVNDPPVAVDDSATTPEDVPVTIAPLANDSDLDGDPLIITDATTTNGTVAIVGGTNLLFSPTANFNGTTTIPYSISDGNGGSASATVTVTVTPINDPPVAVDDSATTPEDVPVTLAPLANDSDLDGDSLIITVATATNGTVVILGGTNLVFTPSTSFNGTTTIPYTISDGNGGSASATVTVTVTPVNDPPVAVDDIATTPEEVPVTIAPLANDSDLDGDLLTITAATSTNGTVVIVGGTNLLFSPSINFNGTTTIPYTISDGNGGSASATVTVTVTPVNDPPVAADDSASTPEEVPVTIAPLANDSDLDGDPLTIISATTTNGTVVIVGGTNLLFTPAPNFNGTTTITYTISDGNGGTTTATVTVTVTPVNDAPVAVDDSASTPEDVPVTIAPLANDSDLDGDPLTIISATTTNGTVVIEGGTNLLFTPTPNFNGTTTITYTISDGNGGTTTATVTVTVTPVNDAPVAVDDSASTPEDVPVTIAPLANDSDLDGDPLTIISATTTNGTVVIEGGTNLLFTPTPNFNGTTTITYTISDGNGGTTTATVTVTVTPVNDAPVAVDDSASTPEDVPVTIAPLANDSDLDGHPLTIISSTTTNGTVVIEGGTNLLFTPAPNFNGTTTITYTISDGNGGTATATVTVTVTPVNDPPVAVDDSASTPEDVAVTIGPLANDSDLDGDPLTITGATTTNGTVVIVGGTNLFYSPTANFNGTTTIPYTISDGNGGTASATVTVTVIPVNDPPVAVDDSASTPEDVPVTIG